MILLFDLFATKWLVRITFGLVRYLWHVHCPVTSLINVGEDLCSLLLCLSIDLLMHLFWHIRFECFANCAYRSMVRRVTLLRWGDVNLFVLLDMCVPLCLLTYWVEELLLVCRILLLLIDFLLQSDYRQIVVLLRRWLLGSYDLNYLTHTWSDVVKWCWDLKWHESILVLIQSILLRHRLLM